MTLNGVARCDPAAQPNPLRLIPCATLACFIRARFIDIFVRLEYLYTYVCSLCIVMLCLHTKRLFPASALCRETRQRTSRAVYYIAST